MVQRALSAMDGCLRGPLARALSKCRRHPGSLSKNDDLLRTRSFDHLSRSISLNTKNYSPQSIAINASKSHILATTLILRQTPRLIGRKRLFASFLVFSKMKASGRESPVGRATAHHSREQILLLSSFSRALKAVIFNAKYGIVLEEYGKTFAVWCSAREILAVDVVPALIVEYAGGNGLAD